MAKSVLHTHKVGDPLATQVPCLRVAARSDGNWSLGASAVVQIPWYNPTWSKFEYSVGSWTYNSGGVLGSLAQYSVAFVPVSGIYLVNVNIGWYSGGAGGIRTFTNIFKVDSTGARLGGMSRMSADSPDQDGWSALSHTHVNYYQKGEGIVSEFYNATGASVSVYEDHTFIAIQHLSPLSVDAYSISSGY